MTPPDDVGGDILTCAEGDLAKFAVAARLAVDAQRDLNHEPRQCEGDGRGVADPRRSGGRNG